jgi:hypothetical protein
MKHSVTATGAAMLLLSSFANAGVVMEMVTRNAAGNEADRSKIYAQSKMVRMEQGGDQLPEATMIFRDNELIYVNHKDQTYMVMDEKMMNEVSAKMNEAMQQIEAQLANMPAEQRAMMEKMLKGQMQGMMAQKGEKAAPPRVEATGNGEWQSHKCREYDVFEGDKRTQYVCAAKLDDVEGSAEIFAALRSMATYIGKMAESLPMISDQNLNPGELMDQIDGFPVHSIHYENGKMVRDMSVDSVVEEDLDDAMFAAPEGYQRQNPF